MPHNASTPPPAVADLAAAAVLADPDLRAAVGDLLDFDTRELRQDDDPAVLAADRAELVVKLARAVQVIGVLLDERRALLRRAGVTTDTDTAYVPRSPEYPYPVNADGPAPAVPPELLAALGVTR
jgi:hypothetical protein